jgi:hypothetical protein
MKDERRNAAHAMKERLETVHPFNRCSCIMFLLRLLAGVQDIIRR